MCIFDYILMIFEVIYDIMSVARRACLHVWRAANDDHESQIHDIISGG